MGFIHDQPGLSPRDQKDTTLLGIFWFIFIAIAIVISITFADIYYDKVYELEVAKNQLTICKLVSLGRDKDLEIMFYKKASEYSVFMNRRPHVCSQEYR
jgi:hypothetical protein